MALMAAWFIFFAIQISLGYAQLGLPYQTISPIDEIGPVDPIGPGPIGPIDKLPTFPPLDITLPTPQPTFITFPFTLPTPQPTFITVPFKLPTPQPTVRPDYKGKISCNSAVSGQLNDFDQT